MQATQSVSELSTSSANEPIESASGKSKVAVSVARENDSAEWMRYVEGHSDACGYHAWNWRRVFQRAFGHDCHYLIAWRNDRISGVLPLVQINSILFGRTLTSLPFLNYGGIVADDDVIASALLESAADLAIAQRCRHVELRHVQRRFHHLPCKQHKVTMMLPVARLKWEILDRKVRNQIRKAEKSGLTAAQGSADLLDEFYVVFARNMRDLGTPVYGREFFEEIIRTFSESARVHVIRLGEIPVAAGLTYRHRDTLEIPWASSVRDYNALCPNHLLYWHALSYAVATGASTFDFGRSTPGEGPYRFKEQWGARPVALHWEYVLAPGTSMPNASPTNPKYQALVASWKRLPLGVANRVGPFLVRQIP